MIEIVFGESEAGAMKIALRRERGLGNDVVCLPLMLDIGDISQPVLSKYRRDLLYRMLYQEQWGADEEMKAEMKALGTAYSHELTRFKGYLKSAEPLRIWYSDAPYSLCGLMWLCGKLRRYGGKVYAVKLPSLTVMGETAVEYSGRGEVEPRQFAEMLPLQRKLSPIEITTNAVRWDKLKHENAPLRAVINGSVISVPDNFYDFLIWKYSGEKPVREAELIGKILGENRLGVGDWWYAARIDKYIKTHHIEIVENSDKKYERILRLNRV
ncbi:MAG: DUF1835 domain-containing protein [Ruminococcaceae bacterium]|nr:DUF1835 domain-containing protein [Oscillospiraceae bacterium]